MNLKEIDRGKILKAALEKSDLSVAQVTRRAGYSRGSYYNHILDKDLPYAILIRYGKALNYDFSIDLPEIAPFILAEAEESYTSVEDLRRELEKYKNKYLLLLEKHQALLERLGNVG